MKTIFKKLTNSVVIVMAAIAICSCSESDSDTTVEGQMISSIATVSSTYYNGLPTFMKVSSGYSFGGLVSATESSLELSYRLNPTDASIVDVSSWSLIRRGFTTRAEGDDTSFAGEIAVALNPASQGELIVNVTDTDGFLLPCGGEVEYTYALVAKYSESKEVVSDFAFFEDSESITTTEITEVKFEYDGVEIESGSEIVMTDSQYTFTVPTLSGKIDGSWVSFEELGFTYSVIVGMDYNEEFVLANNDNVYTLSLLDGDVNEKDRAATFYIYIYNGEDVIHSIEFTIKTIQTESVAEPVDVDGTTADKQYYVDGEITISGLLFVDYVEGYTPTFSNDGSTIIYDGVTWNYVDGYINFTFPANSLSAGVNTVYITFTMTGGRTYIFIYNINVLATPTITYPTVVESYETYGTVLTEGYEMSSMLSNIITAGTTTDDYVTYQIYLTGTNSKMATLYNGGSAIEGNVISGYLKDLKSNMSDYSIKFGSTLSGESQTVQIMVDVLRSGVPTQSTTIGNITFKNPLSFTTADIYEFSYTEEEDYNCYCNVSADVVVTFKTDANPAGVTVYEKAANTTTGNNYGVSVVYSTEEEDAWVSGTGLYAVDGNSSFNITVTASYGGSRYASASQSYITVY